MNEESFVVNFYINELSYFYTLSQNINRLRYAETGVDSKLTKIFSELLKHFESKEILLCFDDLISHKKDTYQHVLKVLAIKEETERKTKI